MKRGDFLRLGMFAPLAGLFGRSAPEPTVAAPAEATVVGTTQATDGVLFWSDAATTSTAPLDDDTIWVRVTTQYGPNEWRTLYHYQTADGTWLYDSPPTFR